MPSTTALKVLLVEDNDIDVVIVRRALGHVSPPHPSFVHRTDLVSARQYLAHDTVDVILLDLSLPDASGIEAVESLATLAPHIPIVVLTGVLDDTVAPSALRHGAQDYILKSELTASLLQRAVLYAVGRQQVQQLKHEQEMAQQEQDIRRMAFASVCHDLRTPVNILAGYKDILLDMDLPQEAQTLLGHMEHSIEEMLALLNDILHIAKEEAGVIQLRPQLFSVEEQVMRLVTGLTSAAHAKHLQLTHTTAVNIPTQVYGDPHRFQQILGNLITNAIKYTESGHITVDCSLHHQTPEHAVIHTTVRDTGPGIPPEAHAHIFEAFAQHDTQVHGGVGLGLTICAALVKRMDGTIGVDSTPGEGSTFWVTLPFALVAPH